MKYIENIVFKELKNLFLKSKDFKIINDCNYIELPISLLQDKFQLSPFQQRNILDKLQQETDLTIRLGQRRKRYFSFQDLDKKNKIKKEINEKLKKINDINKLTKMLELMKDEIN